jgi:hypothetical protein
MDQNQRRDQMRARLSRADAFSLSMTESHRDGAPLQPELEHLFDATFTESEADVSFAGVVLQAMVDASAAAVENPGSLSDAFLARLTELCPDLAPAASNGATNGQRGRGRPRKVDVDASA